MSGDILDRLYDELAAKGAPLSVAECATRYLQTNNEAVAARVLENLISIDSRFRLSRGFVEALAPKAPFAGHLLAALEFAVLDFETNGLGPVDRAIEVGVVVFAGGQEISSFETLIDPGTPVAPFVQTLTGIRPEELRGQPTFEETWPGLEQLIEGRVLVAHNLPFDRRVLRNEVARLGGDPRVGASGLCTLRLSRRLHPTEESHCLDAAASRHGLEFTARHRALDDARVTSRLLWRLLEEAADRHNIATWDDLQRFLAPARTRQRRDIHHKDTKSTGEKGGGVPA